jgi:hypothetical protein
MAAQPLHGTVLRRPREPRVLDDFLQLHQGQLTQAAGPHEHRRMPVALVVEKNGVDSSWIGACFSDSSATQNRMTSR